MIEVAIVHCRIKPYLYSFTYKPDLDLNDDNIRINSCSSQLPVIARHLGYWQTMVSPDVGRCSVYAASFVTPVRL